MAHSRLCTIVGCGKREHARGYCIGHYTKFRKHGDPLHGKTLPPRSKTGLCSIPGCSRKHMARGMCSTHYERWRINGSPFHTFVGPARQYLENVVLLYTGDDCLIWPHARNDNGYAQIRDANRKTAYVPPIVCEHFNGPRPSEAHEVAHSCGRGHEGCVAASHLRWATHSENEADRIIHGTSNRGERHGMARLAEAQVRAIRSMARRVRQEDLAKQFGISPSQVSRIINRQAWAWLP